MRRTIGVLFIFVAICLVGLFTYRHYRIAFWLKPPADKFYQSWNEDLHLLQRTQKLPKEWSEIKEISVKGDNSPVQEWILKVRPPIQKNPNGHYRLDVFIIHWIEDNRYGAVVQYDLIDLKNNNTIWEISRTYKLGIVY
jgi:hypothetical protein